MSEKSSAVLIEHQVRTGPNPFEVDPAADLLQPVRPDVAHYSETMYFHAHGVESGVTAFVHLGRFPAQLDLWWAQVVAVLADGTVFADRSWGRSTDRRGPATGNLRVLCTEPLHRWELSFDGAAERTTGQLMGSQTVGSGPVEPLAFDLELHAATPVLDLGSLVGAVALQWAATHHEQGLWTRGQLRVGGVTYDLAGVGSRDHSTGPRDFAHTGGDQYVWVVFPASGRVLHGVVAWSRGTRATKFRVAGLIEGDRYELMPYFEITGLADFETAAPRELELRMGRPGEDPMVLYGEVLHHFTNTLGEPNVNLNGARRGPADEVLSCTTTSRFQWPDGEWGYGMFLRDYRPSEVPSPGFR